MGARMVEVNEQPADDTPADPSDAQAFAALESAAAAVEGEADPHAQPGAARPPAYVPNTAAELRSALEMARMMVAPMFKWWPEFKDTWSDQTLAGIAEGGAQVMQRHGWTLGEVFEKFGPYIALGMAVVPPSFVTMHAIREHREREAQAQQQGARPASGASGVGP